MQLIWCLLSNFYPNMFRASLCPSSGEQECALPHMVFCTGCVGCGCVELGRGLCALWKLLFDSILIVFKKFHPPLPVNKSPDVPRSLFECCGQKKILQPLSVFKPWVLHSVTHSNFHSAHSSRPSSTQPQPSQPVQNAMCGSAHSCSPDDGHNDARNMLR